MRWPHAARADELGPRACSAGRRSPARRATRSGSRTCRKVISTSTNVADQREFYTFHPDAKWTGSLQWRVRAVRVLYGARANGLPAVSYGPWSADLSRPSTRLRRRPARARSPPSPTRSPTSRRAGRAPPDARVRLRPATDDVRRAGTRRSRALPRLRVHRQRLRQHRLHGLGRRLAGLGAAYRRDARPPRFTVRDRRPLAARFLARADRERAVARPAADGDEITPNESRKPAYEDGGRRRRRPRRTGRGDREESPPRSRSPRRRSPPRSRTTRRPRDPAASSPRHHQDPADRPLGHELAGGRLLLDRRRRRGRASPSRSRPSLAARAAARRDDDHGRGHGQTSSRATSSRSGSRPQELVTIAGHQRQHDHARNGDSPPSRRRRRGRLSADTIVYQDVELPQDVCADGRVLRFGKRASPPTMTPIAGAPFVSGMSTTGRLISATRTQAVFYGSPVVAWNPARRRARATRCSGARAPTRSRPRRRPITRSRPRPC